MNHSPNSVTESTNLTLGLQPSNAKALPMSAWVDTGMYSGKGLGRMPHLHSRTSARRSASSTAKRGSPAPMFATWYPGIPLSAARAKALATSWTEVKSRPAPSCMGTARPLRRSSAKRQGAMSGLPREPITLNGLRTMTSIPRLLEAASKRPSPTTFVLPYWPIGLSSAVSAIAPKAWP